MDQTRVEALIRKLVPWLSAQLGDDLRWLGSPEDRSYTPAVPSTGRDAHPLDAELAGSRVRVAVEHTTVDSFSDQRQLYGTFTPLREAVRSLDGEAPDGNRVCFGVQTASLKPDITQNMVRKTVPAALERLKAYLRQLPQRPSSDLIVRGRLLEEPTEWEFPCFRVEIRRHWSPNRGRVLFHTALDPARVSGLQDCVKAAVDRKVNGKRCQFSQYRERGWKTLLILEMKDLQLSELLAIGEAFRNVAGQFDLACTDYILIADDTAGPESEVECCWAYRDGRVRTYEEQWREGVACFDGDPAPPGR